MEDYNKSYKVKRSALNPDGSMKTPKQLASERDLEKLEQEQELAEIEKELEAYADRKSPKQLGKERISEEERKKEERRKSLGEYLANQPKEL